MKAGRTCRQEVTDQLVLCNLYSQGSNTTVSGEQFEPETPAAGPHYKSITQREPVDSPYGVCLRSGRSKGPVEEKRKALAPFPDHGSDHRSSATIANTWVIPCEHDILSYAAWPLPLGPPYRRFRNANEVNG